MSLAKKFALTVLSLLCAALAFGGTLTLHRNFAAALSAAEQVVGKGLTDTDHEQLIDEFIAKVGEPNDR